MICKWKMAILFEFCHARIEFLSRKSKFASRTSILWRTSMLPLIGHCRRLRSSVRPGKVANFGLPVCFASYPGHSQIRAIQRTSCLKWLPCDTYPRESTKFIIVSCKWTITVDLCLLDCFVLNVMLQLALNCTVSVKACWPSLYARVYVVWLKRKSRTC